MLKHKLNTNLESGFSILEVVIALTILGVLSYSLISGVLVNRDHNQYYENRIQLEEVRKAILSFVQTNGFMPCPDTDSPPDGVADRDANVAGANCDSWSGTLPYQTIGVKAVDKWGNDFLYAINQNTDTTGSSDINDVTRPASFFSTQRQQLTDGAGNNTWVIPRFNIDTALVPNVRTNGNLTVCGELAATCEASTATADKLEDETAIAVVLSYGVNGAETWSGLTLSTVETENTNGNEFFWQAQGTNVDGQFFDDQLIWFTPNDVKAAMLKTERGLR